MDSNANLRFEALLNNRAYKIELPHTLDELETAFLTILEAQAFENGYSQAMKETKKVRVPFKLKDR